jgi:hypothetical protein
MTKKLHSHFRDLADQLETLSKVFSSGPEGSKYKGFFEEYLAVNEFELALHAVCDFLLESTTPEADEATVGRIETLHKLMELQDDCAARVKEKSKRATEH